MRRGIYIFLGAVVLVGALVLYWMAPASGPRIDWRETFDPESKAPYGTYVLQELLARYHPSLHLDIIDEKPEVALAQLDTQQHYTYFYLGAEWLLSAAGVESMIGFLEAGHDVLVISAFVRDNFYEETPVYYCQPDYWMDNMVLSDAQPRWYPDTNAIPTFHYQSGPDTVMRPYRYFTLEDTGCDSIDSYTALSFINYESSPNFIQMPMGEGNLYLHSNPILFTNLALRDSLLFDYIDQVFGYLPPSTLLWDHYSMDNAPQQDPMQVSQSPLSFILSQRALRWAWWLLLIGAVLFVLFRGKRQQQAIPVVQAPVNRSLRFIQTIGQLHFNQKDHRSIARKQYQYWLLTCRQQYQELPQYDQHTTLERLADKSQAPIKLVKEIAYLGEQLSDRKLFATRDLLHFHQLIQDFYRYKS